MAVNFDALFYREPYLAEFEAEVTACEPAKDGFLIELSCSAFYPEGGGQPGDRGLLNEVEVIDTRYVKGRHMHLTREPLPIGTHVHGKVDFERRFELMQQHSGEHLISGLAKKFYGCENVGFHINESETTLDFNKPLTEEDVRFLEEKVNEVVFADRPLEILFPAAEELPRLDYRSKIDIEGAVRLIRVEDVDLCACCGTHVRTSGEIGLIKIVRRESYKGGVRLTALCGRRALRDYRILEDQAERVSGLYCIKSRELMPALERPLEQTEQLKEELKARNLSFLHLLIESMGSKRSLLWCDPGLDKQSLKVLSKKAAAAIPGFAILLKPASDQSGDISFALNSEHLDPAGLFQAMKEQLGAKGGGRDGFYQGQVCSTPEALLQFFEEQIQDLKAIRF